MRPAARSVRPVTPSPAPAGDQPSTTARRSQTFPGAGAARSSRAPDRKRLPRLRPTQRSRHQTGPGLESAVRASRMVVSGVTASPLFAASTSRLLVLCGPRPPPPSRDRVFCGRDQPARGLARRRPSPPVPSPQRALWRRFASARCCRFSPLTLLRRGRRRNDGDIGWALLTSHAPMLAACGKRS